MLTRLKGTILAAHLSSMRSPVLIASIMAQDDSNSMADINKCLILVV